MKKVNVKEWCKEHKKEIIGVTVGAVGGVLLGKRIYKMSPMETEQLKFLNRFDLDPNTGRSFATDLMLISDGAPESVMFCPGKDTYIPTKEACDHIIRLCDKFDIDSVCGIAVFGQKKDK